MTPKTMEQDNIGMDRLAQDIGASVDATYAALKGIETALIGSRPNPEWAETDRLSTGLLGALCGIDARALDAQKLAEELLGRLVTKADDGPQRTGYGAFPSVIYERAQEG